MQNIKKYFMTLALLLTAVGGAWAADTYTITFKANNKTKTIENVTLPHTFTSVNNQGNGELDLIINDLYNQSEGWCVEIPTVSGNSNVTAGLDGSYNQYITISAPFEGNATVSGMHFYNKPTISSFTYTLEISVESPSIDVKWDAKANSGTFVMPAYDVELQVEFYPESNLFLSKDALADKANISVLNGETAVAFGDDGKSTTTVTEGNTVTAKFTGKKVLGMKVAKKAANAYLKWDAGQKKLVATEFPAEVTTVENANTDVSWTAGTYVVEGDVTINGAIILNGDVDLIIKDGAKLTAMHIKSPDSSDKKNFRIYGQSNQSGQLVVNCQDNNAIAYMATFEVHGCQVKATSSYSNSAGFFNIGTISVYGGSVDAECTATNGSGIWLANNGSMNIYGGDVKAVGKGGEYGITGSFSTVTVYGGKLWAEDAGGKALPGSFTLAKGTGFTGKIETSSDGSSWTEYTSDGTPGTKYVRVGY